MAARNPVPKRGEFWECLVAGVRGQIVRVDSIGKYKGESIVYGEIITLSPETKNRKRYKREFRQKLERMRIPSKWRLYHFPSPNKKASLAQSEKEDRDVFVARGEDVVDLQDETTICLARDSAIAERIARSLNAVARLYGYIERNGGGE